MDQYIQNKVAFIKDYMSEGNAASKSKFDANANVTKKNIATLEGELFKDLVIQINRARVKEKLTQEFNAKTAAQYEKSNKSKDLYYHDETSIKPYCVAVSLYPLLTKGTKALGGGSKEPIHLESFTGEFINITFAISAYFAGAIATPEFLMYFDYFARKDYGDNYLETNKQQIIDKLQFVIYTLNEPATARSYQSIFWNISIFDENYFKGMFGIFMFPDGTSPAWDNVKKLQEFFMSWFNKERTKALLTFPVVTANALKDKSNKWVDQEFKIMLAKEASEGNSFFIYTSNNVDSLSSCCRLRSGIESNEFSFSLGAGGIQTGSLNVITVNYNRFIQKHIPKDILKTKPIKEVIQLIKPKLNRLLQRIYKFQVAHKLIHKEYMDKGLLDIYNAGFINMDKQFLTIGINGMLEAAEYLGLKASNNGDYKKFISNNLKIIFKSNAKAKEQYKKYKVKFNTEFVPAENLGVKNAKWDKEDGLFVPRDCYNSYFYPSESSEVNILDKFILHGDEIVKYLDGGSALHLALLDYPTQEGFEKLFDIATETGCNYFTWNVPVTCCDDCGYIDKYTTKECRKCGSKNIDYATRIIGYLRKIGNFSKERQIEALKRNYQSF